MLITIYLDLKDKISITPSHSSSFFSLKIHFEGFDNQCYDKKMKQFFNILLSLIALLIRKQIGNVTSGIDWKIFVKQIEILKFDLFQLPI